MTGDDDYGVAFDKVKAGLGEENAALDEKIVELERGRARRGSANRRNSGASGARRRRPKDESVFMDEHGLFLKDNLDKLHRVSQPFEVLGRCRSPASALGGTTDWGLLIRFTNRDNETVDEIIGDERLYSELGALCGSLAKRGMDISISAQGLKVLAGYLQRFDTTERVTLVHRAGWHEIRDQNVFVLPDRTISRAALPENVVLAAVLARRQGMFESRGTVAQWRDGVGRLAGGHFLPMLAISTALAGSLLRLAGVEGGGVHIYGPSSTGKTTVVKMAASVWRRGVDPPTWRATANGLEGELARASDSFMPLDELGQVDAKEFASMVYMSGNAVGKMRMNRDTTARDSLTWLTLILSSGETPIEIKLTEDRKRPRAGHLVRLLDVKADRANGAFDEVGVTGVLPFVNECGREAAAHYGVAGPEFVRRLLNDGVTGENVRSRVDEFVRSALQGAKSDAGQSARAAQRFGLIAAAGEMAIEFDIAPWAKGQPTKAASWAFKQWVARRGKDSSYEARQAIEQVRGMIERYGDSRFDDLDPPKTTMYGAEIERRPVHDRLGFRKGSGDDRRWLVLPEMFHKVVCDGLDSERVAATLAEHDMLERGEDRNLAKKVNVRDFGNKRFYVLTPKLFEEG
jgi:uncharacterized protein (DUF927 family)